MSRSEQSHPPNGRRISHAAIVCFSVSAIAFVACAMGLFVNHMLTGSLAISGTAAVGLIYLAIGLMNLGVEREVTVKISATHSPEETQQMEIGQKKAAIDELCAEDTSRFAVEGASGASTTHDVALSSRE